MDPLAESSCVIAVFAKAPIPGKSKTRLITRLGAEGASNLQAILIERTLRTAIAAKIGEVELWCASDTDNAFMRECAARFAVTLRRQCDGDIGQRMHDASRRILSRAAHMVLIGCDCPALTPQDLTTANMALTNGHHAVLLPVEDGGYTLIALRESTRALFDAIDWGTEHVVRQTRERLLALRWQWSELPIKWDVDRPADYERMRRQWPELFCALPHTCDTRA